MSLQLPPELEQRVTNIARESKREPVDVLTDIVSSALELDDDAELWASVAESDAELARGEGIRHEQVMQDMQSVIDRARSQRG